MFTAAGWPLDIKIKNFITYLLKNIIAINNYNLEIYLFFIYK